MITHQSTEHPKLMVLGGRQRKPINSHLEYELRDIIGNDTFAQFMLNFTKVMSQQTHTYFSFILL